MAKGKLDIIFLAMIVVLNSCNVIESTAFKFKEKGGCLTSHPEKIYKENLEVSLNSIISSNQKYQGLNSELNLKSQNRKPIHVDSINTKILSYRNPSRRIESVVLERFSKQSEMSFPMRLKPDEIKRFVVIIPNQNEYEFHFGDSVKIQVELFCDLETEKRSVLFERIKYYDQSWHIVMP